LREYKKKTEKKEPKRYIFYYQIIRVQAVALVKATEANIVILTATFTLSMVAVGLWTLRLLIT
jgi:hypothetical protein